MTAAHIAQDLTDCDEVDKEGGEVCHKEYVMLPSLSLSVV